MNSTPFAIVEGKNDQKERQAILHADTWDTICETDMIRIETSAANGFTYNYDNSGQKVFNDKGIEIVVKGLSDKESWIGPSIVIYFYNSSNHDITVVTDNVSVNGFMVESHFSSEIARGKHIVDSIAFSSSELEEDVIDTIETVELVFRVYDTHSWDAIFETSPITIGFEKYS